MNLTGVGQCDTDDRDVSVIRLLLTSYSLETAEYRYVNTLMYSLVDNLVRWIIRYYFISIYGAIAAHLLRVLKLVN